MVVRMFEIFENKKARDGSFGDERNRGAMGGLLYLQKQWWCSRLDILRRLWR